MHARATSRDWRIDKNRSKDSETKTCGLRTPSRLDGGARCDMGLGLDETASVEPSGGMAWQHSTKQTLLAIPVESLLCFAQYIF